MHAKREHAIDFWYRLECQRCTRARPVELAGTARDAIENGEVITELCPHCSAQTRHADVTGGADE